MYLHNLIADLYPTFMFRLDEYEDPRQRQKESGKTPRISEVSVILPVLWIQMRMHPELLPTSGFGIIVLDPDPAKYEGADK